MTTRQDESAQIRAVTSLLPWEKNPRKIGETAIGKVAKSIEAYGFGSPILVQKSSGRVLAGHTRLLAAKKLGLVEVPVRVLDLSDAQARALAIADNRTAEETEWDDAKLAELFAQMQKDDQDLVPLGFDTFELADICSASGELDMGAPRTTREQEAESFRFRLFKIAAAIETGDRMVAAIQDFADKRGTLNGFVEHVVELLEAAAPDL